MIKILFVTSSLAHDGTQTFIMNVYRQLDKTRFHADFLLTNGMDTDFKREVIANGSQVYVTAIRRDGVVKFFGSVKSFFALHHKEYQAIHFNYGSLTSILAIWYAHKYKIPVRILHSHNSCCSGFHNRFLHGLFKSPANGMATHHFACSEKAGIFFSSRGTDYKVIKNGIDVNFYSYNSLVRENVRKRLGFKNEDVVIGHVGRFNAVKNHSFILDVFEECCRIDNHAKLVLIGDGELLEKTKEKAKTLGIENKIMFLGRRSDVNELMQAMDCFLMPSLFEGLPFVLVEAQASALPCVITDVIDKKVDLTGNIHFLSLNSSPTEWADCIIRVVHEYKRTSQIAKIKDAGYDIVQTTRILERVYSQDE